MNNEELLLDLSLDDEQGIEKASSESNTNKYKERKVEHKLTKYEAIIKNVEKINRINESQVNRKENFLEKLQYNYFYFFAKSICLWVIAAWLIMLVMNF
jgi:hypothetical protein